MAHPASTRLPSLLLAVVVMLLGVTAGAQGAGVGDATPAQKQAASQAYQKGVKAMEAKRFDEALEHFKVSYETVKSPNSHFMMVRTLRELGRKSEAYAEAKKVVAEAEEAARIDQKYAQTGDHARELMQDLSAEVGLVSLIVDAPAESTLRIDDRDIPRDEWSGAVAVDPGSHTLVLETPTKRYEETVTVEAGEGKTVVLPPGGGGGGDETVEPADTEEPSEADAGEGPDPDVFRTASYVSFGVGGVGGVLFAVFGGLALSTFNDLEDSCPGTRCSPDRQEDADRGSAFQTTANVGLVVGIVGISAGIGLLITSMVLDDEPEEEEGAVQVRPGPLGVAVSF